MPRDLFGDVTEPSIKLGTRKWYSVPLSFAVHTFAIGAVIVAPLVATGTLPPPSARVLFMPIEPPPLPQPPPVRRVAPEPRPSVDRQAAPVVAPSEITPEPEIDAGFEADVAAGFDIVGGPEVEIAGVVTPPPVVVEPPPTRPVRPGGNIRSPQRVTHANPVYPPVALAARVQGIVIIDATIDVDGRVQAAKVLRTDSPLLNEAALAAVRQWVFTPTLLNGIPVSVVMTVTVQFRLQ
jgi:protein TonB